MSVRRASAGSGGPPAPHHVSYDALHAARSVAAAMYLMTYVDEETGKIVYTLKACGGLEHLGMSARAVCASDAGCGLARSQKVGPDGKPTVSAHPARFSPDDKFSRVRAGAGRQLRARGLRCNAHAFLRSFDRSASSARSASACCRRRSRRWSCEASRARSGRRGGCA